MSASNGCEWTLEAAQRMLGEVRSRTQRAAEAVEKLMAEREQQRAGSPRLNEIESEVQACVSRWAREMEALGVDVKGLWLIDFDNGNGYYCWRWPEDALEYFHGYEEGFSGRVRIQ